MVALKTLELQSISLPFYLLANNLHMVDGTDVAEVIGHDWFFKILDPPELAYTYKIRPAMDFGGIFVSLCRFI